ncbi:Outer membrane protein [Rubellimicrobium mesophilum DSM 19309]|uniref:Outer membrane protein n=1 Tax=Rubellimicrobium mesophilum DSM 19309 TaxID=442562 RepID=A0A017HU11_9RHOB|nr:OmpA family protein [Rubellimicrobium mesophilum]EYD77972.1 Outer membrane protein [Rubellimicrobium mesophilum DSM 19309]
MAFERLTLSVMAGSLLALAACQQPLPNQQNDQTRTGALIGAGVGAAVGAATGDDSDERIRNALVGAAVFGAAGAGIGAALDRQEAELRAQLGNGTVTNTGNELIVTLPNDILFATDSDIVSAQSQADLRAVAVSLNNYPNTTVNVVGNTDSDGDAAYNQDLSERRARNVANVLIASGVSAARINAIGQGENVPVATNQTAAGKQQNRRVEIVITPNR